MMTNSELEIYDTIIIGGGQAGLSVAYFLQKTKLKYLILDNQSEPGGAWQHTWDSLKLFSPAQYSSLSGWQMPATENEYPTKLEFLNYLSNYEKRYDFPIKRDTIVINVSKKNDFFQLETNNGLFLCKTLVSATGAANSPYIPEYHNAHLFKGKQIHSINYKCPNDLHNQKVLLVGAGNSGSQILAEVSKTTQTTWVTIEPPVFLPEHIDGRYLFIQANNSYLKKSSNTKSEKISLINIVQVESVKEGLTRGIYKDHKPFSSFYE
ncbi:FAD-dependent oxidoreductase [Flavicella sp.]|uniref:FAD-dependent oxidoreductase n=1 Tax=Flavicella sp. TaxID=2957742 RepID=UPI00260AFD7E|nr:FAD-dependent oxidoreductase [Flavicella sp.]MDG1805161.1 FAD-dependent oxidoreductase [Flavicella sp.]